MNKHSLHKIPEGFIITSDETIKEGNKFIIESTIGTDFFTILTANKADAENSIKSRFKVIAQQYQIDFSSLSEEEQKRIGWFDVEEIFKKMFGIPLNNPSKVRQNGFEWGFLEAKRLLSDRRFTLNDVKNAIEMAQTMGHGDSAQFPEVIYSTEEIIQSLSQPKSWKVELEMEKILPNPQTFSKEYDFDDIKYEPKLTNDKVKILRIL